MCALRQIVAQPRLVDLPVAVLDTVEQHHRKPVPELGAALRTAGGGFVVDIGRPQLEAQLGGQFGEPVMSAPANFAARTGEQFDDGA